MAAGLSLRATSLPAFRAALEDEVRRHAQDVELQSVLHTDGELEASDFELGQARALRLGGPWGQHFPEPVFDGEFALVNQRLVGERHLKMTVQVPASGTLLDAIAFNIDTDQWPDTEASKLRLAYRLDVNEYRGQQNLQLVVEELQKSA